MRTAVDRMRLDLLRELRQPLPYSLSEEQETWKELQYALSYGLGDNVSYRYPKS